MAATSSRRWLTKRIPWPGGAARGGFRRDAPPPRGERRRRLVHDQKARIREQRPGDLHDLLPRDVEVADAGVRIDPSTEAAQDVRGPPALFGRIHAAETTPLAAEEEVLPNRQRGDEVELLVDGGDPRREGVDRPREGRRRAADLDPPRIRPVRARHDLDQRALARAVLADERVHLARADLEVRAAQGAYAGERLLDAGEAEDRRVLDPGPAHLSAEALSLVSRSQGIRIDGGTVLPAM